MAHFSEGGKTAYCNASAYAICPLRRDIRIASGRRASFPALRAVSTAPPAGRNKGLFKVWRNMARQIHCVVENADDLDHLAGCRAIHDEMPPAPTFARDMERPKVGENFITGDAAEHVGASFERRERFGKRGSVNVKLPLAEFVFGVFQDAGEILFSLITKANPPARSRQLSPAPEATLSASLLR